jgi:hypothetical protein
VSLVDDDGNSLKETTGAGSAGAFAPAMGYEKKVQETTTSASSGAYVGPAAWGGGDLMKGGKSKAMRKPIWKGGTMIQESNYLTDPKGFAKYIQVLNEQNDVEYIQKNSEAYGSLNNMNQDNKNIIKKDIKTGQIDTPNLNENLDAKYAADETYRFGVKSKYVIGLQGREDILYFKSEEEAMNFVSQKPTTREYLGDNLQEETQTMIQNNGTSMSNKPQATGDQGSGVPMGMQATGGMNEESLNPAQDAANAEHSSPMDRMYNSDDWVKAQRDEKGMGDEYDEDGNLLKEAKLLEELNNELNAYSIHQDKLKKMTEDRKPSALVLRDRVGSENEVNFKKDLQHSGTKEIIDIEKELQWKDQQTDVPKDPQKLGMDIEKKALSVTKGEALKNVGDSANDKGDEIPKRNLTKEEQDEVNNYRLGLGDLVYDNEVGKRFEDRMKADMGDTLYQQRQDKLKFRGKAPMYNKEAQPTQATGVDKVQFDKEQSGWNERDGIKESMITGRYMDALGKRKLIDFTLNEVKKLTTPSGTARQTGLFELDFTGLGNTYNSKTVDNKVSVNEGVVNAISSNKFYTDGKQIFAIKNPAKSLNENVNNDKPVVNEQMDKMKHLLGYKPETFTNTTNVKKNRGF